MFLIVFLGLKLVHLATRSIAILFDDFWNLQNFVKIWTHGPTNYYQIISKYTQNAEASLKILISRAEKFEISKCCKSCVPNFQICFAFLILEYGKFEIMKSRRRGLTWHQFSIHKICKTWIWISSRSKKYETKMW